MSVTTVHIGFSTFAALRPRWGRTLYARATNVATRVQRKFVTKLLHRAARHKPRCSVRYLAQSSSNAVRSEVLRMNSVLCSAQFTPQRIFLAPRRSLGRTPQTSNARSLSRCSMGNAAKPLLLSKRAWCAAVWFLHT